MTLVRQISDEEKMKRFLLNGVASNQISFSEKEDEWKYKLKNIEGLLLSVGEKSIEFIVDISTNGKARKNDYAIVALAVAASQKENLNLRRDAIASLEEVCRIPTHLFMFLKIFKNNGGKTGGNAMQKALQRWYKNKNGKELAYHMVKYRNREGWNHGDVLRLARPKVEEGSVHNTLFAWTLGKEVPFDSLPKIVQGFSLAEKASESELPSLVREYELPREAIPDIKQTKEVWDELIFNLPIWGTLRNLSTCSRLGCFNNPIAVDYVVEGITSPKVLTGGKVHPLLLLEVEKNYALGKNSHGKTWPVNNKISSALLDSFMRSFGTYGRIGKKICIGLDVSESMSLTLNGSALSPREITTALSLIWLREEGSRIFAFSHYLMELRNEPYKDFIKTTSNIPFGSTNPSLVLDKAIKDKTFYDAFIFLTDNEINGGINMNTLMKVYREKVNPNAKLVFCAVTSSYPISAVDLNDPLSLEVNGYDSSCASVIEAFLGEK